MKIGFVWAIISVLIGCVQTQERTNPEDKAEITSDEYSREIARLETIILQNPRSSQRWQAHFQLAQLYISYKNPRRNYQKALENLKLYFPHHPTSADDHDLRNWLSVLDEIKNLSPKIASQNKKIEQLTAKLKKSKQANLALKKANKTLKSGKLRLEKTNSKLKKYNVELAKKIDMLKTLDHHVEQKRKNYNNE
jgi:small-conductance mechanosensitive channel